MGSDTLAAVAGSNLGGDTSIKTALVSVFNKSGLEELAKAFIAHKVHVLSTGGTAKKLRELGCTVQDVADYTGSPEILDGRVKSLHPKVHGGLLAVRGNADHEAEMKKHGIVAIDMVVANLYPFSEAVKKFGDLATCTENIDIGGPCMVRAAAKNHAAVTIVSDPNQYQDIVKEMNENNACVSQPTRLRLSAAAYALTAQYDSQIANYMAENISNQSEKTVPAPPSDALVRFSVERSLKYGCNPHQNPSAICRLDNNELPFTIVNGTPGYINLLDAINAWQLVVELHQATKLSAAASFKHVSPAGAAISVPLSEEEKLVYECGHHASLSDAAIAYIRARNADPLCSFGDFVAISSEIDESCAMVLKTEVSDGIIAPSFTPEALEILKKKKDGKFVIIQGKHGYEPPEREFRSIFGVGFTQKRNDSLFDESKLSEIVTQEKNLPPEAKLDLILASICIKYTQSNSVGYACNGMMIGVGAGQQSRVDCVKLAGRKVKTWYLRFHPKVKALEFKEGSKRQQRVNARVRYIEGDMTKLELESWGQNFENVPSILTEEEKNAFLQTLDHVTVSSDAFFPFRDSIDHSSKMGVKYIAQPGGSVADKEVIQACDEYKMIMAFTNLRLFHH